MEAVQSSEMLKTSPMASGLKRGKKQNNYGAWTTIKIQNVTDNDET